jgi:predicted O-linked N-acetylglucosamine transferase (SPINDLY family)
VKGVNRTAADPCPLGSSGTAQSPAEAIAELMALHRQERHDLLADRTGPLLRAFPDSSHLHTLAGAASLALGDAAAAERAFRRAVEIDPRYADAHNNLGVALERQGRAQAALGYYAEALRLRLSYPEAHNNLGDALRALGRSRAAIDCYRQALRLRPDYARARANLLHQLRAICDWTDADDLARAIPTLGVEGQAASTLGMLAAEDDPGRQFRRAVVWARERHRVAPRPLPPSPPRRPDRLRVGYFSSDFADHPVARSMAGLLRAHDRSRFAIHAYSLGAPVRGADRARLLRDTDRFVEAQALSDAAIVDLVRADGIDVAVDLNGYTRAGRSGLFARRLAPVQINFLGYPGTMGAAFMDYIVADRVVIPEAERAHYAERVLYMPDTYWPTDDRREMPARGPGRAEAGLPDRGMAFCCFNAPHKIGPAEFDVWMRLLRAVEGAVLWLYAPNRWARANLRRESAARGVAPDRLVFAPKLPAAEHLARHRHADLFLDTFAYNAHTTASDALWAGLPVLTLAGRQFAARVGASLLTAAGLPGLIAANVQDYERIALDLALDPARLAATRAGLAERRSRSALFDTVRYTRALERGLELTFDRYLAGLGPADLAVPPD